MIPKKIKNKLKNKNIVVFGGSYGIGGEIVRILRDECRANVYSFSRSENNIDVTNPEDITKALNSIPGEINHIISTPGYLQIKPLLEMTEDEIDYSIEANFRSVVNVLRIGHEYLKSHGGTILAFGSTAGILGGGRSGYCIYSSMKSAIITLIEAFGKELNCSESLVKVLCMVPRRTKTPMRFNAFGEEPKGTLLDPAEVARVSIISLEDPDQRNGGMVLIS